VYRILLEALAVTLGKDARARAVQLPAWNEALGLPRPWDQQWSLRLQQILAYETDLLEYDDVLAGSHVIEQKTAELSEASWTELNKVLDQGGSVQALEYMKRELVASLSKRQRAIEAGDVPVVGVNRYQETVPSQLETGVSIEQVDADAEKRQIEALEGFRRTRDAGAPLRALDEVRKAAREGENLMPASIEAARAGVTTGEWSDALREVFGEFRAPTGVSQAAQARDGYAELNEVRDRVARVAKALGVKRLRMLVGKPGLDGHSNGAEQIAVRARDAGYEVVYQGIRLTPEMIAQAAVDEDVHVIGLSILSGAHAMLVPEVIGRLKERGVDLSEVPVVVGGIIPDEDARTLEAAGVAKVYTPKDFDLTKIVGEIAGVVARARGVDA
jgi:(2R)-ethylmalonyl-CoA mutase